MELSSDVALVGRFPIPLRRKRVIPRHASTCRIALANGDLRSRIPANRLCKQSRVNPSLLPVRRRSNPQDDQKRRRRNNSDPTRLHAFFDHLSATIPDSTAETHSEVACQSTCHSEMGATSVELQLTEKTSSPGLQGLRLKHHPTYSWIS